VRVSLKRARNFRMGIVPYLGVKCTRVSRFFNAKDSLDPGHYLVGRGVGRLVQVYAAITNMLTPWSLQRGMA